MSGVTLSDKLVEDCVMRLSLDEEAYGVEAVFMLSVEIEVP